MLSRPYQRVVFEQEVLSAVLLSPRSSILAERVAHLRVVGELTGSLLRIDLFAVGKHLEAAIVIWDERELTNALFILGEQLFRQTDGFRFISSGGAVFDADFHDGLLGQPSDMITHPVPQRPA